MSIANKPADAAFPLSASGIESASGSPNTGLYLSDRWRCLRADHEAEVDCLLAKLGRQPKGTRGKPHPVYDFLFSYYRFRPASLRTWSPGWGIVLQEANETDAPGLQAIPGGAVLPAHTLPERRRAGLMWVIDLLESMDSRPPVFSCHGLHEWAMVYRCPETRHPLPLRTGQRGVADLVESRSLVCTHYDAFRFFTPLARPRNRWDLTKTNRPAHEQPGCIHANMDLYKWSHKFYPWIGSSLILAAFRLAIAAREIDMRASPYDLSEFGFKAIPIELPEGRAEYEQHQRELSQRGTPLRRALIRDLRSLCAAASYGRA